MNKKEMAAMEAALTQAALRSTGPVKPDVPIPTDEVFSLSTGYLPTGGGFYGYAEKACSSPVYHGIGSQHKTTSQGGCELYSTKLLALRQLRYRTEQESAKTLRRIDVMIEQEEGK